MGTDISQAMVNIFTCELIIGEAEGIRLQLFF